ncbi:MAG: hypothetical protein NTZ01_08155 [Verrucomicrobia bacterium]|nr:hypothetical protein [Verrucomicrobiota bacterium]
MIEGGDRGFLFRMTGLALLVMVGWKLGEAGGLLAAKDQLLANREAMTQMAPLVLLGLFFLRGPLPARKSIARVAGFQFLNLGFLVAAVVYGLAAVPLGVEFQVEKPVAISGETDWAVRDRLREVEMRMAQLEKESAAATELPEWVSDSRRREADNRKQERLRQMEDSREERNRLTEEVHRRGKVLEDEKGKEKSALQGRLERAQQGSGWAAVIYVLLGLHGLFAGFLGRGGVATGGFPVVSTSGGKIENSIPGALRPKRSVT